MGNQKVREKKKPTFFLAVLPILAMILLLGVGYAVMGLSPEVLMLVSAAVAAVIAIALGYTWDDIMDFKNNAGNIYFNHCWFFDWFVDDWWNNPDDGILWT